MKRTTTVALATFLAAAAAAAGAPPPASASGSRDARAGYCALYSEIVGNDAIAGCNQGAAWVRVVGTCRRVSDNAPYNFYGPWVWSYNDQTHSFYECGPGWYVSGAYGQRR